MAVIEQSYKIMFYAPILSKASCFTLLIYFLTIAIPFYLSFSSELFWSKPYFTKINPEITPLGDIYLKRRSDNYSNYSNSEGTFLQLTSYSMNYSQSKLYLRIIFDDNITFENLDLYLTFKLYNQQFVQIDSFILVKFHLYQNNFKKVNFIGTLTFQQRHPYNLGENINQRVQINNIQDVIQQYRSQKEFLKFVGHKQVFIEEQNQSQINILLTIHSGAGIYYIRSEFESMKFNWMLYFSLLVVFLWIAWYILNTVFENNMIEVQRFENIRKVK